MSDAYRYEGSLSSRDGGHHALGLTPSSGPHDQPSLLRPIKRARWGIRWRASVRRSDRCTCAACSWTR